MKYSVICHRKDPKHYGRTITSRWECTTLAYLRNRVYEEIRDYAADHWPGNCESNAAEEDVAQAIQDAQDTYYRDLRGDI